MTGWLEGAWLLFPPDLFAVYQTSALRVSSCSVREEWDKVTVVWCLALANQLRPGCSSAIQGDEWAGGLAVDRSLPEPAASCAQWGWWSSYHCTGCWWASREHQSKAFCEVHINVKVFIVSNLPYFPWAFITHLGLVCIGFSSIFPQMPHSPLQLNCTI